MNKQVECNSNDYFHLTKGKIYEVNFEFADCIGVTNDVGVRKKYPIEIFTKIINNGGNSMNINANKIRPTYYGNGFDVIDFCQKNNLDFMQGNVIKYVTRYKEKNGKEDLFKAMEYIERMIKEINKQDKGE